MQRAFEKIIEKLKKEKSKHRYDRGEFWCYRDAIEIVNEVASEYCGGWIPCSEMLPEAETEEVLVTDGDFVYLDQWNEEEQSFEMNTDIIAWQPLPEPYKAEREDNA